MEMEKQLFIIELVAKIGNYLIMIIGSYFLIKELKKEKEKN